MSARKDAICESTRGVSRKQAGGAWVINNETPDGPLSHHSLHVNTAILIRLSDRDCMRSKRVVQEKMSGRELIFSYHSSALYGSPLTHCHRDERERMSDHDGIIALHVNTTYLIHMIDMFVDD